MNTTNRPKQTKSKKINTDERVVTKLKQQYPELYDLLSREPIFDDLRVINKIIKFYERSFCPGYSYMSLVHDDRKEFELEVVLIILKIFDPDWLDYDHIPLRQDVKAHISNLFDMSGQALAQRLESIRNLFRVDRFTRIMSVRVAHDFLEWYNENNAKPKKKDEN